MDANISKWLMAASLQSHQHETPPMTSAHYASLPTEHFTQYHDQWIVDGGATSHFTGHKSDFVSITTISPKLVKGMNLNAVGIGTVKITTLAVTKLTNSQHNCSITLHNVLYILDMLKRGESVTRLL